MFKWIYSNLINNITTQYTIQEIMNTRNSKRAVPNNGESNTNSVNINIKDIDHEVTLKRAATNNLPPNLKRATNNSNIFLPTLADRYIPQQLYYYAHQHTTSDLDLLTAAKVLQENRKLYNLYKQASDFYNDYVEGIQLDPLTKVDLAIQLSIYCKNHLESLSLNSKINWDIVVSNCQATLNQLLVDTRNSSHNTNTDSNKPDNLNNQNSTIPVDVKINLNENLQSNANVNSNEAIPENRNSIVQPTVTLEARTEQDNSTDKNLIKDDNYNQIVLALLYIIISRYHAPHAGFPMKALINDTSTELKLLLQHHTLKALQRKYYLNLYETLWKPSEEAFRKAEELIHREKLNNPLTRYNYGNNNSILSQLETDSSMNNINLNTGNNSNIGNRNRSNAHNNNNPKNNNNDNIRTNQHLNGSVDENVITSTLQVFQSSQADVYVNNNNNNTKVNNNDTSNSNNNNSVDRLIFRREVLNQLNIILSNTSRVPNREILNLLITIMSCNQVNKCLIFSDLFIAQNCIATIVNWMTFDLTNNTRVISNQSRVLCDFIFWLTSWAFEQLHLNPSWTPLYKTIQQFYNKYPNLPILQSILYRWNALK